MRIIAKSALVAILCIIAACSQKRPAGSPEAPVAKRVPVKLTLHGQTRVDNYYWIRDDTRSNPAVLKLLNAENQYTREVMAPAKPLQDTLFSEIAGRLQDSDRTVPVREGNYLYHREFRPGHQYPIYIRRQDVPGAPSEVMLDVNVLSIGHDYYQVGNWSVSPNNNMLAFAEDSVGRREYTIRFKNLATGKYLPDEITGAGSDLAWANDNKTLFYLRKDPETLRPWEVYRHELGTSPGRDKLVYAEKDPAFYVSLYATSDNDYIVIRLNSIDSSEVRLVNANRPARPPTLFLAREPHLQYEIRHVPGWFYIITNWKAKNFRLMKTPEQSPGDKTEWQQVVPARRRVLLEDVEVFSHYIALQEASGGLTHIRVLDRDTGTSRSLHFPDPTYTARLFSNPDHRSTRLRYVYSSLTTPDSVYEYDMATHTTRLLKRQVVGGGFERGNYVSRKLFVAARDGAQVPVSLVYRKSLFKRGKNPLLVTAYGAYGIPDEPTFRAARLSLLDRGFVFAIIHVRGGNEMGQGWYADGRLLNKENTFHDFVDATRGLLKQGFGQKGQVFATGASAGGLIMGVIANQAPRLYSGIVARVPFVDLVTTMADPSIPLTSGEFREWGNPRNRKDYDYMLQYSPYDQVRAQAYPAMFITAALYDSQVQYYGPVKWAEKLRHYNTGPNRVLVHIEMDNGHSGASSRYDRYRLQAMEYAFILRQLHQRD